MLSTPEKRGLANQELPKAHRFALLEQSGMPAARAARIAGYNTSPFRIRQSETYKNFKHEIREKRVEIAQTEGFTLSASAKWYKSIADDASISAAVRLKARELLDKLLGYFAPIEVESDTSEQKPIVTLIQILQQHNVNPLDLLSQAQSTTLEAVNQDCNNAIKPTPPATEPVNAIKPIKHMSQNNYYVNYQEVKNGESRGESEEKIKNPGTPPHPIFYSGRGGRSDFSPPLPIVVPSPYHEVCII